MDGEGSAGTGIADGDGAVGVGVVGVGAPGNVVNGAGPLPPAGASGLFVAVDLATRASAIDVEIKIAARITVVRVNAFAVPRPVMRPPTPPPVPRPKPPPSERCSRITPIMAMQTTTWTVMRTANMGGFVSVLAHATLGGAGKRRFVADAGATDYPCFVRQRWWLAGPETTHSRLASATMRTDDLDPQDSMVNHP